MSPIAAVDRHSFARPEEARVVHVSLDLAADFAAHALTGAATLTVARAPGATELVLDTDGLAIAAVTDAAGAALRHRLAPPVAELGRALAIELPAGVDRVVVRYATTPDGGALQWLRPEQTAGRAHPYLFSQGQAILTRTWIPTQDSPGIRQTYDARVTVPGELAAVMSAEMLTPEGVRLPDGRRRFDFRMPEPIPPYLIALAIGDLRFRAVGPRTGVYAEPGVLDAAAAEFGELERLVDVAESIGGRYRWGRYDVLVLPPSFPFGGMENPRLTFVTPTIIAGDRSLVSLIAHELAHSWSGNLVTNATWDDFWLNEGFTTYFENRIIEAAYGVAEAEKLAALGRAELVAEMAALPADDTRLVLDLAGRDPDDGMTRVAYEKGAALLGAIERAVGRPRFDAYLRGYFDRHAFRAMTTDGFVADLAAHLYAGDPDGLARLELDAWLHRPGLPAGAPPATTAAFEPVAAAAARFAAGQLAAASIDTRGWRTPEWQHLLERLLAAPLTAAQVAELDAAFHLGASRNYEILSGWLLIAARRHHDAALPAIERLLTGQGRRKYLKPLYEELMASEWGRPHARRIYGRARAEYHSVAVRTLDDVVR